MSEITQVKCDECGKIVADKYLAMGWISLTGSISIARGRDSNGQAHPGYSSAKDRDFCCMTCLGEFMKALK